MDWDTPPIFVKQKSGPGFRTVIFDLTQPADNVHRYYTVTWQTDLFGESNVVRSYGRKGGWNRTLSQPFESLEAAWPFIRRTIKTRLRHGYHTSGNVRSRCSPLAGENRTLPEVLLVEMEPAP